MYKMKNVKIITTIIYFFLGIIIAQAKDLSVTDFFEVTEDLTAKTLPVLDRNDNACALVKVVLPDKAAFEGNHVKIEYRTNEYYIYLSPGTQRLVIKYPGSETLTVNFSKYLDSETQKGLKGARTYRLKLNGVPEESNQITLASAPTLDYQNNGSFQLKVQPTNAEVLINGLRQSLDSSGALQLSLPFGSHSYRINASKYYPEEGQFKLDKNNKSVVRTVSLKPQFGYLTIDSSSELEGAEVSVDGSFYGTLPIKSKPIDCGNHTITISKKMYLPLTQNINVSEGNTVNLNPQFQPNYAIYEVSVKDDKMAKIYIDDVFVGNGDWKGKLETGTHIIDVQKDYYKTASKTVEVVRNISDKVEFPPLVSEFGTLNLTTYPSDAIVVIDGQKTYNKNIKLLAGKHNVTVSKPSFNSEEFEVIIHPNQISNIEKILTSQNNMTIFSEPSGAMLYIDGKYVGLTPFNVHLDHETHNVLATMAGYEPAQTYISTPTKSNSLKLNLTPKNNYSTSTYSNNKSSYNHSGYYSKYKTRSHKSYEDLYIKQAEFYLQIGYNQGIDEASFNYGIGVFYKRFNSEFNMKLNPDNGSSLDLKIGIAIPTGYKFRITPQLGLAWSGNEGILYAVPAEIRFNLAFSRWIGLYASPGYNIPIKKRNDVLDGLWGLNGSIWLYVSF